MSPIGQHLRLRLEDDRVITPSYPARRSLARIILRHSSEFDLLSFGCADTHLHIETTSDRASAIELDRRIKILIRKRLHPDVGFQRSRIDDVKDQWHLFNTFRYTINQDGHHGCRVDPFMEATVLPDLLGMRIISSHIIARVRALLPRVSLEMLVSWLDVAGFGGIREELRLDLIPAAAAAAVALPNLNGNKPAAVAARRMAVHIASRRLATGGVAELLGLGERTVKRMRSHAVDPVLHRAIELQLQLRTLVSRSTGQVQADVCDR